MDKGKLNQLPVPEGWSKKDYGEWAHLTGLVISYMSARRFLLHFRGVAQMQFRGAAATPTNLGEYESLDAAAEAAKKLLAEGTVKAAKLYKVRAKQNTYDAFHFTVETEVLPTGFNGTIVGGEKFRKVVLKQFGKDIPYPTGTWFIQKGNVWEAKKQKPFEEHYEVMVEPSRESALDAIMGLPQTYATNIHELLNAFESSDRSHVDANIVFAQDQLISWIRRHLDKVDPEPVAWIYELACAKDSKGGWTDWEERITTYKPNVSSGAIRNLRALFAPWDRKAKVNILTPSEVKKL